MAYELENPQSHAGDEISLMNWLGKLSRFIRSFYTVMNVTAACTVRPNVFYYRADATNGAFTVSLPDAAVHLGKRVLIKKVDSSANAVTVSRTGSDTIEGSNTVSLSAQWDSLYVIAGAANSWEVISS